VRNVLGPDENRVECTTTGRPRSNRRCGVPIREMVEVSVAVVALALPDVFDTVVVPGESRGALRVARRPLFALPVWKRIRRGKTGISTSFAPTVLMASFVTWMAVSDVQAVCDFGGRYSLRSSPDLVAFAAKRADYALYIEAIAEHRGTPTVPGLDVILRVP
jgi:hypothetical protein